MTWTCSRCNKILFTKEEYEKHVCIGRFMSTCPMCIGSGKIVQAFGPAVRCALCHGKGKV